MIKRTWIAGLLALCCGLTAAVGAVAAPANEAAAGLTHKLADEEAGDGRTSPDLLPVIDELAHAQWTSGALDTAVALRRRALTIAIAAFGRESPKAIRAMTVLASLNIVRGDYVAAEPLLIIAETEAREDGREASPPLPGIFSGLARVALARGDTKLAEAWAERAVTAAKFGPHGGSAEALRALGAVLTAERRFPEAERALTTALAQDRPRHGKAGGTARTLSLLARLYLRQGRAAEALPLIEQAAAIDQRRLGPTHPFIADDFHDLGLVYEALDRNDDARGALRAALRILNDGAGRDTPRVAYAELELSRLDRRAGDRTAADAEFKDAQRILTRAAAEEWRRERRA